MRVGVAAVIVLLTLAGSAAAKTAHHEHNIAVAPAPLQFSSARPDIRSSYGSGSFGRWEVDRWGLPTYQYTADEMTDPNAPQANWGGGRSSENQIGNDDIKGMAFDDGYTQMWSQDILDEWANDYDASARHYSGGYGYLDVDGHSASTLYLDNTSVQRWWGAGYYRKQMSLDGVSVKEVTYAPFGDDPVLLDDVTLTNTTPTTQTADWFEYWDVNPCQQAVSCLNLGVDAPTWNASTQTLVADQIPTIPTDTHPLESFAAALQGPSPTWDTSVTSFFGDGTRAVPQEVAENKLSETVSSASLPGGAGKTLFVFRSPVTLAPGQSVTLRYVYGMAVAPEIAALVSKYKAEVDPLQQSEEQWIGVLPRISFGSRYAWLSRELEWNGYLLRSATADEQPAGEHTITQGGDYQYGLGANIALRDPLQFSWPTIYSDPSLTQQVMLYTLKLQTTDVAATDQLPYGTIPPYLPFEFGTSDDLDLWLLQTATLYGMSTRDMTFFHQQVPFYLGGQATVWEHIKLAFEHEQTYLSAYGEYITGVTGDWNDLSVELEAMDESTLILAQATYVYQQLAALADLYGDPTFAAQVRTAAVTDLASLRKQWIASKGWYSRGYAATSQIGTGVIFEEPQPWAILAGAPTRSQAEQLIGNIHRYLDGYGAPGGPTKLGTAMVPGYGDPGVTEHGTIPVTTSSSLPDLEGMVFKAPSTVAGADEWPGGVWYSLNGDLTWAYGTLQGEVPGAVDDAWWEFTRNTLAQHATAYPNAFDGIVNVDDVCDAYYSPTPRTAATTSSPPSPVRTRSSRRGS